MCDGGAGFGKVGREVDCRGRLAWQAMELFMFACATSHAHYILPVATQAGRALVSEIALDKASELSYEKEDLLRRGVMRFLQGSYAKCFGTWRFKARVSREYKQKKFAASRTQASRPVSPGDHVHH